eukprot:m.378760 g.378760  ORF g.378760 m.378760 type:complete len:620 (+) comp16708_c2_seq1:145-2004(+)
MICTTLWESTMAVTLASRQRVLVLLLVLASSKGHAASPNMEVCLLHTIDAGQLNPDELRAAFAPHRGVSPVVLRNAATATTRVTLVDLAKLAGEATVQVGTPAEIVGNSGQGARLTSFAKYLASLDAGTPEIPGGDGRGEATDSSRGEGTGVPTGPEYAFDRGQLWKQIGTSARRALLSGVPDLLPPSENRSLPSVGGFRLTAVPDAVLPPRDTHEDAEGAHPPAGYDVYFAIGGDETGVSFHYHAETLMLLHAGTKRWFSYPPNTRPIPRHHHPRGLVQGWPPLSRSASHYNATISVCDQHPGDVVYLPSGWHHGTINLGATFGLALQARVPLDPLGRGRQLANGLAAEGRFADAVEVLRILIASWPNDPELRFVLGTTLLRLAALAREPDATPTAVDDDIPTGTEARTLAHRGRFSLNKALDLDPDDDRAALALCRGALEELEASADGSPTQETVAARLANDAARGCTLAPSLNPFGFAGWFYHGRYQAAVGELLLAGASFRRATLLDPTAVQAWYHLANALMQGERTAEGTAGTEPASGRSTKGEGVVTEAAAAYTRVLELQPDFAQPRLEFGILLQRAGQQKQAVAQFRRVIELSPELAPMAEHLLTQVLDRSEL